jgi:hypothetical protein
MGMESPETSKGFEQFDNNPEAKEILEKVSLEYLTIQDKEYFDREFTGELDSEGYLIPKDGSFAGTKPSMNIGGGQAMQWVIERVKAELDK